MTAFATTAQLQAQFRTLTADETGRASALLDAVSDRLRQEAKNRGKDLDAMVTAGTVLSSVLASVTCDVAARALLANTSMEPMSQFSQSALGYSVSGTVWNPGGGIFFKRTELQQLGLLRQKVGCFDPWA